MVTWPPHEGPTTCQQCLAGRWREVADAQQEGEGVQAGPAPSVMLWDPCEPLDVTEPSFLHL